MGRCKLLYVQLALALINTKFYTIVIRSVSIERLWTLLAGQELPLARGQLFAQRYLLIPF